MEDGVQLGTYGADDNCDLITYGARRTNWKALQEVDEEACARRFCEALHPELTKLDKIAQNSEVDILASEPTSKDGKKFQITSLWPQDFWKPLGSKGASDKKVSRLEILDLIRTALEKKLKKYSTARDVILLVDTHPAGIPENCLKNIESDEAFQKEMAALNNRGFEEVWVVSSDGHARIC